MTFHDVELSDDFQYVSSYGVGFNTKIQESSSGHELRVIQSGQPRHRYTLTRVLQTQAEALAFKQFGIGRRGSFASFKVKDHSDFTTAADAVSAPSSADQTLGSGTGTKVQYQLFKTYDQGGPLEYERKIVLPVDGTVVIAIDGTPTSAFTVNSAGVVTFSSAPGAGTVITCGFEFRVPGRFEKQFEEWLRMDATAFDRWDLSSLGIIEVLDEVEWPDRRPATGAKYFVPAASDITLTFNDGQMIVFNTTAAINVFLPAPGNAPPHLEHFLFVILSTSSNSVTVRDDVGNTVAVISITGSTFAKRVGFYNTTTGHVWVVT